MKAYTQGITKAEFVKELRAHQKADRSSPKEKTDSHRKAAWAVHVVSIDLASKGFTVSGRRNVSANGPDLTIIRGDFAATVEVKAAFFTKRAWKIGRVKRLGDTFLATVFPNGAIHYDTIKDHVDMVGERERCLTHLGRIYGN